MKITSVLLLISLTVFSGCYAMKNTRKKSAQTITPDQGNYILVSINGKKTGQGKSGAGTPSMYLNPDEKKISGFGGCNRFFGSLETTNDSLVTGPLAATKMGCPEGDSENTYLEALSGKALAWFQRRNRLILKNNNHTLVFRRSDAD